MPQHVAIRVDVGGTVFHTSLHTLMEGARLGGVVFQALCLQILGPGPWEQRVVPAQNPQYGVKHFVDADPTPWLCWIEYLRSGEVPFVETGPLRARVIRDTRRAGLAELAEGLEQLVDWRREELQALLARKTVINLHGARLRGQDLSNLGFAKCSLRRADLSDCALSGCSFDGADLQEADLQRAWFLQCDLRGTDLRAANLRGATLPPWNSGLMEGVKLSGATGWVPADGDMRQAKLKGSELEGADLEGVNLSNADLSGADLRCCNLAGATLPPWSSGRMEGVKLAGATGWVPADRDLRQSKFKGADLSGADLKGASMSNADLQDASLSNADLSGADMKRSTLSNSDLSRAKLAGANLSGCNLPGAILPPWASGLMEGVELAGATGWMQADRNLSQAKLKGADLSDADLSNANLSNTNLQAANLRNAVLSGADLEDSDLSDADLRVAPLTGANLSGCNLSGATLPPLTSGLMEGVNLAGATGMGAGGGCNIRLS